MSAEKVEVYKALRDGQNKYTYFLLTGAGAAIGFALTQTNGKPLALTQMPLGAAVLCWGLSFFFGCMHVNYSNATLYANAMMFQVREGNRPDPRYGNHPDYIAAACEGIKAAAERNADSAKRHGQAQFLALIAGALFYIAWHVIEMYLRTPGLSPK